MFHTFVDFYLVNIVIVAFLFEHSLSIIQFMHSFEVDIRICQPENSDVHRGEHHFRGLTNPDVNLKRIHQLFCYMTLSLFS